jgi:MSHA biogenesis protein MshE
MNNYRKSSRLGDILLSKKEITRVQLDKALAEQAESGKRLGETLIGLGYINYNLL